MPIAARRVVEPEDFSWMIHARFTKELVCDRRRTFETTAAVGRDLDRAEVLRVGQEEQLFHGIELVLSDEALEKVSRYAVGQSTIREIDFETWYGKLRPEIVEHLVDRYCELVTFMLRERTGTGVSFIDAPPGGAPNRRSTNDRRLR